jgi:1-acyl-sn-glycerol-3-phosphate acyltransferase
MIGSTPRAEDPRRWRRRVWTLPLVCVLSALLISVVVALMPALLLIDLLRSRRLVLCRAAAFFGLFGLFELTGLFGAALTTLSGSVAQHRLQHAWSRAQWWGLERCFGMSATVEGAEALRLPGPAHVFLRHISTADTLLALVFYAAPMRLWARFALKQELLVDPLLDIVGHRMGSAFLRRASGEGERDAAAMARLAAELGADEITVLYPEGTRFTPARRAALLEKARADGKTALVAAIERCRFTLPPRRQGPLALFAGAPQADLVLIGHVGLEGTHSVASLWNGALIGQRVRLRVWRWPASSLPADPHERFAFLEARWAELDAWVGASAPGGP